VVEEEDCDDDAFEQGMWTGAPVTTRYASKKGEVEEATFSEWRKFFKKLLEKQEEKEGGKTPVKTIWIFLFENEWEENMWTYMRKQKHSKKFVKTVVVHHTRVQLVNMTEVNQQQPCWRA